MGLTVSSLLAAIALVLAVCGIIRDMRLTAVAVILLSIFVLVAR